MTGSNIGKTHSSAQPAKARPSKAWLALCGALAFGLAAGVSATAAQAQFFRHFWAPDDDGYPPPIPPREIGHHREAWAPPPPYVEETPPPGMERMPLPTSELRRRATLAGLKLLGTPHRKADVFVGFGEDSQGRLHHLTFDAYDGRIVENEVSTTAAKAAPGKPAAPAATAVTPPKPSAPAATATAAPVKPATHAATAAVKPPTAAAATATPASHATAPAHLGPSAPTPTSTAVKDKSTPAAPSVTAKDDELSPIKPQPGTHGKPPLPDSEIDKD